MTPKNLNRHGCPALNPRQVPLPQLHLLQFRRQNRLLSEAHMSAQTEEQHWSGPGGHRWRLSAMLFEKSFHQIGEQLLDRAALVPGQHVLEIGCGAGGLTLDIAKRVAPAGSVTGLDISAELCA